VFLCYRQKKKTFGNSFLFAKPVSKSDQFGICKQTDIIPVPPIMQTNFVPIIENKFVVLICFLEISNKL
jgi:hypothetical protein